MPLCCFAFLWCIGNLVSLAVAETLAPAPILPERLIWSSPPSLPALQSAWMVGTEASPGLYLLRVRLASGGRIPPHIHPDERITTVLAGTLYIGFGPVFDETRIVAVPTGAVLVAPAGTPHFVWAKEGEALYQETGRGPTGTVFLSE